MGLLGDSWDDPRTMATLQLAAGLLGGGGFGKAASRGLSGYQQTMAAAQQEAMEKQKLAMAEKMQAAQMQMSQLQIAEMQRQAQERERQQQFLQGLQSPQTVAAGQALAGGGGPTVGNAAAMPKVDPMQEMMFNAVKAGVMPLPTYLQSLHKDNAPIKLGKDDRLLDPVTRKVLVDAMPDPAKMPAAIQEYEYAKQQGYGGTFQQFVTDLKKAGATNIGMPKIEVKMGESVAGQIGPMAKDSRVQAQGAVGMFDSADRIQKALDSGKASAGPFTTQIQTVKQLVQKVSGGNDEGIRQTRQVIKGLAQMAVEARKELQGQGAVTESEGAAVAKAESGDINDLSTGELQDLVTLTKRAAHMRAKSHQSIIDSMAGSDATKGMVPFYQVNNLDKLLKHSPQLPQIGAGNAIDEALKKYGGK